MSCLLFSLLISVWPRGSNGVTNGAVSVTVGESSGKASKGVAKYSAGAGMAQAEQRAGGAMSEIGKAKQVGLIKFYGSLFGTYLSISVGQYNGPEHCDALHLPLHYFGSASSGERRVDIIDQVEL